MDASPFHDLRTHLDSSGRLVRWPSRRRLKNLALSYLAGEFELGRDYTERQVNEILLARHTFEDVALLRRELFEAGFLGRERDCSRYWRTAPPPENPAESRLAAGEEPSPPGQG